MGWKRYLLFHFQLPHAYSGGLQNMEHSIEATQHFHFISLCFPHSSQSEPLIPLTPTVHPCLCLHSAPSPWTLLHLLLGSISWCSFFKAQVICHLQEGTLESVLALVKFPITEYLKHLPGLWIQTHLSLNLGD